MTRREDSVAPDRIRPVWGGLGGQAADAYLATELATSAPHRLQAHLYDAAIRLCRQAAGALTDGQVDLAGRQLRRARKVVRHLRGAVQTGATPEWADRFAALYEQVHRRLIEADYYRRRESIHESIELLDHERPAWSAMVAGLERRTPRRPDARASWIG
jgi:flagellar protein FliS